jgi:phage tail sheath protein FI
VIGGDSDDAPAQDEGRLIYVRPDILATDSATRQEVTLPASYAAAAVAGRIAALDAHFSPTNKTVNVGGLATIFNGTQLAQLVLGRTMALERRLGSTRIVKGITTSTNTAWAQVTTRRIVDYARYGVRSACDPYIGKLNNERVRQAMKSTISGFLNDMVDREMLISYELEVSATREQQIRGIAQVTMTLRPTFSIDYIRVIMFLE